MCNVNNESMKFDIKLSSPECVKELIQKTESGIYETISDAGERVFVFMQQNRGMDVHFYQKNCWIRVDGYDKDGFKEDESYRGRWDEEDI